jgi:hypothetical protein
MHPNNTVAINPAHAAAKNVSFQHSRPSQIAGGGGECKSYTLAYNKPKITAPSAKTNQFPLYNWEQREVRNEPGAKVRNPQFRPNPPIPQTTLTTVGANVNMPP